MCETSPAPPRSTSHPHGPLSEVSSENLSPGSPFPSCPSRPLSAQSSPAFLPHPLLPCLSVLHTPLRRSSLKKGKSDTMTSWPAFTGLPLPSGEDTKPWHGPPGGLAAPGLHLVSLSLLLTWLYREEEPGPAGSRASLVPRSLYAHSPPCWLLFNSRADHKSN